MTSTPIQHDWFAIGQSVFLFAVGLITAWNAWRASRTAKTVNQIHTLTNSAMGAQKTLAEVTAAKAVLTVGLESHAADQKAADEAMADYLDHVKKQSAVDSKQG
jgi:hypothetical protein